MNSIRYLPLVVVLSAFAGLSAGCSKADRGRSTASRAADPRNNLDGGPRRDVSDSWDNIKDFAFERRDDFAATLDRLAARREADLQRTNAEFAGLPDGLNTDRDRAVRRYKDARTSLQASLAHLRTSTADTWVDAKRQTAASWAQLLSAYDE